MYIHIFRAKINTNHCEQCWQNYIFKSSTLQTQLNKFTYTKYLGTYTYVELIMLGAADT